MNAEAPRERRRISYSLITVVYEILEYDKRMRYYGTDQQLFLSEIHMIKAIGEEGSIHVTGLAERMGITKGAVSQIVKKLQNKGMVIKDKDARNLSKLALSLTEKGETAYRYHARIHREFDDFVNGLLEDAAPEQREFLSDFLERFESQFGDFAESHT